MKTKILVGAEGKPHNVLPNRAGRAACATGCVMETQSASAQCTQCTPGTCHRMGLTAGKVDPQAAGTPALPAEPGLPFLTALMGARLVLPS